MPFCPACGTEYRPAYTVCADCHCSLIPSPPALPRQESFFDWVLPGLSIGMGVGITMAALTMSITSLLMGWSDWFFSAIFLGVFFGGVPLGILGGIGLILMPLIFKQPRQRMRMAILVGAALSGGYGAFLPVFPQFGFIAALAGAASGYLAVQAFERFRSLS